MHCVPNESLHWAPAFFSPSLRWHLQDLEAPLISHCSSLPVLCCVEEDKGRRRINCLTNTSRAQSSPHSQECGAASLRVRSQVLLVTQSDKINHPAPSLWLISQKKLLCLRDPDKEAGPVFACCFAGQWPYTGIHQWRVASSVTSDHWAVSSLCTVDGDAAQTTRRPGISLLVSDRWRRFSLPLI